MQQQLPLFPGNTKLINCSVGVFEKDGFVYYLHNSSPIYCHAVEDKNSYMFITSNLVVNGLCTCREISDALGVKRRNIERYVESFRKNGPDYFFNRTDKRGQCHKMTLGKIAEVQSLLDLGYSQQESANRSGVSESAVRYHLRKGTLKKSSG